MRKSRIAILILAALMLGSLSVVQAAPLLQHQVQITSPETNAQVRGIVPIMGSSSIADFQFYKIEFGVGPNPSQWAIVGILHEQAVMNGQLELWDTTRIPDGVYSLRLQAVKRDGNYEEFFVRQILVVNTQPTATPTRTVTPTTVVTISSPTPRPTATLQIIAPGAELALPTPTPTLSRPEQTQTLPLDPEGWGQSFLFGAAAMGIVFVLLGIVFGVRKLL